VARWHAVAVCVALTTFMPASVTLPAQVAQPGVCPLTEPVRADAPRDPNADPVSGYWHISTDRLLWAPASAPGRSQTGVGRYWVRPQGTPLTFVARRLDVPGPEVVSTERTGYPTGFYFGTVDIPTDGCWEITARAGASQVTFVVEIRYPIERFARQPATRLVWSKEIGRIEEGDTRLAVMVVDIDDPASVTRRARGIRIDLTNGLVSDQLWEEGARLSGTRGVIESWAAGRLPMVYGLGRTHNAVGDASGLTLVGKDHRYSFPGGHRPAELARLFLQALDELNAQAP
jgi:hypothetical protein